jgi:hypothetical protein
MKTTIRILLSVLSFSLTASAEQPFISGLAVLPDRKFVETFSADYYAHQVKIENILVTKNFISSLGGVFPMVNLAIFGMPAQASVASSVHFEVRPMGQAHVVSTDFYVDYLILDMNLRDDYYIRFVTGHTSHHLSDNWYERLQLTQALHYSRDYVELSLIYAVPETFSLFAGANYGYIFHLPGKENMKWMFHAGGEKVIVSIFETMMLYTGVDIKLREEANYASSQAFQFGVRIPMPHHPLKIAYQFRNGLDERGQFFGEHISRHTVGLYIGV